MLSGNISRIPEKDYKKLPPTFFNTSTLAGKEHQLKKGESTVERIKRQISGVVESAKNVHLELDTSLPWEFDTKGRLYSTDSDKVDFKIKWLRAQLGLAQEGDIHPSDYIDRNLIGRLTNEADNERRIALLNGASNLLIQLEAERALQQSEANFRQDLIKWMMGSGRTGEYKHCWWITKHPSVGDENSTVEQLLEERSISEKDADEFIEERQKLITANPAIPRGIVEQTDLMPLKTKVFLDHLRRTAPKTDEEFYLWYKYIIREKPINYDYIFEDYYNRYFWSYFKRDGMTVEPTAPPLPIATTPLPPPPVYAPNVNPNPEVPKEIVVEPAPMDFDPNKIKKEKKSSENQMTQEEEDRFFDQMEKRLLEVKRDPNDPVKKLQEETSQLKTELRGIKDSNKRLEHVNNSITQQMNASINKFQNELQRVKDDLDKEKVAHKTLGEKHSKTLSSMSVLKGTESRLLSRVKSLEGKLKEKEDMLESASKLNQEGEKARHELQSLLRKTEHEMKRALQIIDEHSSKITNLEAQLAIALQNTSIEKATIEHLQNMVSTLSQERTSLLTNLSQAQLSFQALTVKQEEFKRQNAKVKQ